MHIVVPDFVDHHVAIGIGCEDVRIVVIVKILYNDSGNEGIVEIRFGIVFELVFFLEGVSGALVSLDNSFGGKYFHQQEAFDIVT